MRAIYILIEFWLFVNILLLVLSKVQSLSALLKPFTYLAYSRISLDLISTYIIIFSSVPALFGILAKSSYLFWGIYFLLTMFTLFFLRRGILEKEDKQFVFPLEVVTIALVIFSYVLMMFFGESFARLGNFIIR